MSSKIGLVSCLYNLYHYRNERFEEEHDEDSMESHVSDGGDRW